MFVGKVRGEIAGLGHPGSAGQGIGTAMLSYAMETARPDLRRPVKVIATLNAQTIYEKRGVAESRRYTHHRNQADISVVEMVREILTSIQGTRQHAPLNSTLGRLDRNWDSYLCKE